MWGNFLLKKRTFLHNSEKSSIFAHEYKRKEEIMSEGQVVYAKPDLTGLKEKVAGKIIKIRQNPFLGTEIAIEDAEGRIFFGEERFFSVD